MTAVELYAFNFSRRLKNSRISIVYSLGAADGLLSHILASLKLEDKKIESAIVNVNISVNA